MVGKLAADLIGAQLQRWVVHCLASGLSGLCAACDMLDGTAGRVFIHPASVNFTCGSFPSGYLVYTDIVETSKACAALDSSQCLTGAVACARRTACV